MIPVETEPNRLRYELGGVRPWRAAQLEWPFADAFVIIEVAPETRVPQFGTYVLHQSVYDANVALIWR